MLDSEHRMFVRIDGEPFLSRVIAYRAEMFRVRDVAREFMTARGATEIAGSMWALKFPRNKVPEGWRAPDRKGWSQPKKNHTEQAALAALPRLPKSRDVFGKSICEDLSYKGPDHSGSGGIGFLFDGPRIGWAGDVFFALIPDAAAAVAAHLAEYPNDEITNGADQWTLPSGLTRISNAEYDLIMAQHAVAEERKKREAA